MYQLLAQTKRQQQLQELADKVKRAGLAVKTTYQVPDATENELDAMAVQDKWD